MQFLIIIAIVVGAAVLMHVAARLDLPEKTPLYVALVIILAAVLWWLVGRMF